MPMAFLNDNISRKLYALHGRVLAADREAGCWVHAVGPLAAVSGTVC
jgi:hypothetical protein